MIPILYESTETAFVTNGLCRLRDCISCKVTEERNGIYECDFEYPVDGANFELIKCGRIIAVTHDETGDIQPFDIVSYEKPIDGIVTFHAVHISYRQSYLTVYGTGINSLSDALTLLASAEPSNPFTYSTDFTSSAYMAAADGVPRSVRQMLGGVEGSILDAYGGEYEWDKFNVTLHSARGVSRDLTIRYGVNMKDYKDDTDYSGAHSSCIPFWKGQSNGNDVVVVGSRVDSGLTQYNGRNDCLPMDLSDKFEDKPTAAQLQSMALTKMRADQSNLPQQTINVDFVRLQDFEDYAGFADLLICNLCDTINVVFPQYNMSGTFKIVKTEWDVLLGRYETMQLGALSTSLAEALGISATADSINSITDLSVSDDLTVGGNASVVGSLTLAGHSSAVGTIKNAYNSSTVSLPSSTWKAMCSVSLEAGTWIVLCGLRYPSNASGYRESNFTKTSADNAMNMCMPPASGVASQYRYIVIVQPSSTTTYYLNAYQNSGSTLTMPVSGSGYGNFIKAVRLL